MKLLFVDTETGGINEKENSLLAIGMIYWNDKKVLDKLEIYIRENEYNVTSEAMKINGLKLEEVRQKGLSPQEVIEKINRFIIKNFGNEKAVVCGQNINFDIRFLKELYKKTGNDYEKHISYRSVDTASILRFLTLAEKFGDKTITSLDDAIQYFNIDIENRHTALGDAEKTVKVFNRLLEICK